VQSAVIINSWTPAYLVLLLGMGIIISNSTLLYYKRFLFQESEDKLKQLLKTHFYSRGFLTMPFLFGLFYDGIFSMPFSIYNSTGDVTAFLYFSSFGFLMFVGVFYSLRPDISFVSFFYLDRNFDQFRILRLLKKGPRTKNEIRKCLKTPKKIDLWLNFLIEKKAILFRKNRYELIMK
jgi:hypothetical protein